ncbi:hypothetical protein EGT07_21785 [Herbaspirillum sp. HC18]|nr:hypothetical protein EGT07_21785 [Herbaspirillum sp. HC18]
MMELSAAASDSLAIETYSSNIQMAIALATTSFETERFIVVQLSPSDGRKLAEAMLQDEALVARVQRTDRSPDEAGRDAYGIELQAASGQLKMWSIVARDVMAPVGVIIARNSVVGIDVEVLVPSRFWCDGVAEEAREPVIEWLEDHAELIHNFPSTLH